MVGSNFLSRRLVNLKLQRALLNGVKKAGNVHELALFTPHQFVQSKCCLQTYPSCILNVPEIEKLHFPKLGLVFLWDCER